MNRHLTEDELVLHYYGEMSDAAEAGATAHLDSCVECRAQLAQLQRVLALVDVGVPPEPDAAFEARTWQRLEPSLKDLPRQLRRSFGLFPWSLPPIARLAWGAAACVVVLGAFAAGRFWPDARNPERAPVAAAAAGPVTDRVLLVDLGDHLDRAEGALVEFVSRDPATASIEPARTEDLIAANRLYRATATLAGDQTVVDVLDELERALIEIAAVSTETADAELEAVRQWIDSRDLLFKVRVIREVLQERGHASTSGERQDSSL